MSIRIYALAKELDIESKILVDLCQKLGMGIRGSALASLTDEEIALVKSHLDQQKAKKAAANANSMDSGRFVPPSHLNSYGKVPNLPSKPRKARTEEPARAPQENKIVSPVVGRLSPSGITRTQESPVRTSPAIDKNNKTDSGSVSAPVDNVGATSGKTVTAENASSLENTPAVQSKSPIAENAAEKTSAVKTKPQPNEAGSASVETSARSEAASAQPEAKSVPASVSGESVSQQKSEAPTASPASPEQKNVVATSDSTSSPAPLPASPSLPDSSESRTPVSSPVLSCASPVSAGSDSELSVPYTPVSSVSQTAETSLGISRTAPEKPVSGSVDLDFDKTSQSPSAPEGASKASSDLSSKAKPESAAGGSARTKTESKTPISAGRAGSGTISASEVQPKSQPSSSTDRAKPGVSAKTSDSKSFDSKSSDSKSSDSKQPVSKPSVSKPSEALPNEDSAPKTPVASGLDSESVKDSGEEPIVANEPAKAPEAPVRAKRPTTPIIKVIGHRDDARARQSTPRDGEKGKSENGRSTDGQVNRVHRDGNHPGPLTMRLAPMPTSKAPVAAAKPSEPAAMKPDIRLSTEVIRATKAGVTPLADHLKRAENQRLEEDRKKAEEEESKKNKKNKKNGVASTEIQDEPVARGKVKGKKGADVPVSLGGREQRQLKRKRQGTAVSAVPVSGGKKSLSLSDDAQPVSNANRFKHLHRTGQNTAAPRKNKIVITLPITVRSFAEELGLPVGRVLGKLMQIGQPLVITSPLDLETAEFLASEFSVEVEIRAAQTLEEKLLVAAEEQQDAPADLKSRAPIITFLGHVDHGKTSLLDRIIGINVCSGEKGGITQHIRAYQISKSGQKITFVDTPGHQAFTEMRARGANCTDIAVLVVAADDGVMPQTEEAISHARAAGVPIVVALNKIDIPGVNIPKVMQGLASNDLLPSEWGGDVEVVKCSAITGEGIDELLDTVLTVAELHEFKANPQRKAMGICVESRLNQEQGASATVLVQNGTLKVGDIVVCGSSYGRVKAMTDTLQKNKRVQKAIPSMPVNLFGLDKAPGAGDKFYVLDDISDAREIAARKTEEERQKELMGSEVKHVTLENLFDSMGERDQVQTLNIILRTDVRGSIEAIRTEIGKLDNPEVQIRILQAMVGGITEADVALADASDAVIIGFNVVPDENARVLADQKGVQVRRYDIIYKLTDDLRAALEGMLKPEEKETDIGRIAVLRKFVISHVGTIAGCRVLTGSIQRSSRVRIIRDNRIIGDYAIDTLKHEKDDVKEALQGHECGIKLQNFNDIKEGDIFEAYKIEEVSRKL